MGRSSVFQTSWTDAKKKTAHANEQDRRDVLIRRRAWVEHQPDLESADLEPADLEPADLEPGRLVFIDETWAKTNMARTHGRAPRWQRLRMSVSFGHWQTTTFVSGLTLRGMIAPFVITGPINRLSFEAYVEKVPIPDLRPKDIVIMDNLGSHKGPRVQDLIEAAGVILLFLPPCSPDFNPIEKAFSELKAMLRKAAERTVEDLWSTIGTLTNSFTPTECKNYFSAAGYDPD